MSAYSQRMKLIIDGVVRAAARRALATWYVAPLMLVLVFYLRRKALRFETLLVRAEAGISGPRSPSPPRPDRPGAPRKIRLPGNFAWLRWAVPEVVVFAAQMKAMLAEPELVALLAKTPRAGEILRPVLHMLGETAEDLPPKPPKPGRSRPVPPPSPEPTGTVLAPGRLLTSA